MKNRVWNTLAVVGLVLGCGATDLFAHCEIPCGIYTDEMRIDMIEEDCKTIEKAMNQIQVLGAAEVRDDNQIVRWITNKEEHANRIQDVVTQYFMTQRIKPGADQYERKIGALHEMLIQAMKCKQTTDTSHVAALRALSAEFAALYFGKPEATAPVAAAPAVAAEMHDSHEGHSHDGDSHEGHSH